MDANKYWESRYNSGGNSGRGSYGIYHKQKTLIIKNIIKKYDIKSVVDLGCGDGNQIINLNIEKYVGYDISQSAIDICKLLFNQDNSKRFELLSNYKSDEYDLAMSLDVIYHIVNYDDYIQYLDMLFNKYNKYVIIYSTNHHNNDTSNSHVTHRKFTDYVDDISGYELLEIINDDLVSADFYIYKRK